MGYRDRQPLEIRFWSKVQKTDTCWLWIGTTHPDSGYGLIRINKKLRRAHRVAYELAHGVSLDDENVKVRHSCDNTRCVRPRHLLLGTQQDNVRDMHDRNRFRPLPRRRFCKRGLHEMTDDNVYVKPDGGRLCRACMKIRRMRNENIVGNRPTEVVMGRLHFATIYPWCCPEHGPLVPRIGGHGGRGRYVSLDRGVIYRWRRGLRPIIQPERDVVWMDVPCDGHTVRVHYDSCQYYPIIPVAPLVSLHDAFWCGEERYPVVEDLLRRLYDHGAKR